MGCTSSKVSAPRKSQRAVLYGSDSSVPDQRYLSVPAQRKPVASPRSVHVVDKRASDEAARPKETFEAYADRGLIRQSALIPEGAPLGRNKHLEQKKRVGGIDKYRRE